MESLFLAGILLTSKNFKKGVYYKAHFTINDPNSKGRLIFLATILCQYSTVLTNIILKKTPLPAHLGFKKGLLMDQEF